MKFRVAFTNRIGANYYLDASNRSRNRNKAVERSRPFINIGKAALKNGEIPEDIVDDFRTYLAFCQIQSAKVFLIHLEKPVEARNILLDTNPIEIRYILEKYLLLILSFVPPSIIKFFWRRRPGERARPVAA